jgi:hypothetical protein
MHLYHAHSGEFVSPLIITVRCNQLTMILKIIYNFTNNLAQYQFNEWQQTLQYKIQWYATNYICIGAQMQMILHVQVRAVLNWRKCNNKCQKMSCSQPSFAVILAKPQGVKLASERLHAITARTLFQHKHPLKLKLTHQRQELLRNTKIPPTIGMLCI